MAKSSDAQTCSTYRVLDYEDVEPISFTYPVLPWFFILSSLTEVQNWETLYKRYLPLNIQQGRVKESFGKLKTKYGNMEAGCELKSIQGKGKDLHFKIGEHFQARQQ